MKKLFLEDNKIFTIIIYGLIFLYILFVSYFILWDQKPTPYFYEYVFSQLFFCIIIMILIFILENSIKKQTPISKEFRIYDIQFLNNILILIELLICIFLCIYHLCESLSFVTLAIIPFLIYLLSKIKPFKNQKLKFNYAENCLYFDNEKILFEDIEQYSITNVGLSQKYTIYLKNSKEFSFYELVGTMKDYKNSLYKNLRYLKIPERILD